MTHKDKPPRMLVPSLVSTSNVLSTNPPPLLSLTVLTRREKVSATFSFSILVVVLLMFHSLPLKTVSSKLRPPMVTLTWVVKISITESSTTAFRTSRRRLVSTLAATHVLSVVFVPNVKRPSVFSQLLINLKSNVRLSLMVRITLALFLVPSSRNFALISSESACLQLSKSSRTQI